MATNDNAISCGADFTLEELLSGCIGKDSSNKPTLRLYESAATAGSKFFACGNPVDETNFAAVLKNLICLDSNGDFAVRVSILP